MKKQKIYAYFLFASILALTIGSCKNWTETGSGSLRIVTNKGGQTLGYDTTSKSTLRIAKHAKRNPLYNSLCGLCG